MRPIKTTGPLGPALLIGAMAAASGSRCRRRNRATLRPLSGG